jgi:hypothetical protein
VLPPLLPELEKGLLSIYPWLQETSILALGAIADGCGDAMVPHMAQLPDASFFAARKRKRRL